MISREKSENPPAQDGKSVPRLHPLLVRWMKSRSWKPFPFQEKAWIAYAQGLNGLVNAPTGMGKTYSIWLGVLSEWFGGIPTDKPVAGLKAPPLSMIWITPLRALANDTLVALQAPVADLALPWTIELRTGDTSASKKQRHRKRLPSALVITPESLCVMLSYPETAELMKSLQCAVVDEWHELIGTKRGTQTELALARLRSIAPRMRTWGLSATLGNLEEAMETLAGGSSSSEAVLIAEPDKKKIVVETLIPREMDRFPWAGHIGLKMLPQVINALSEAKSTLIFTNTRSQAELWFQNIVHAKPEWADGVAIHHGSIDRDIRIAVEERLRDGSIRCVVCTSSLDLGVDFPAVDQVIQIGSPKGIARLLQRAGRSGHSPGRTSRILCVPTNAFELVEYAATREAIRSGRIENRSPLDRPVDTLLQHMVTLASGGGFDSEQLCGEIRSTRAFRELDQKEWDWCLDFLTRGGNALGSYDQYRKLVKEQSVCRTGSQRIERLHRMNIGTITGDADITLKLTGSGTIGTVEENFLAKLAPGDRFVFSGRVLQLVRVREMTATVRFAESGKGILPTWGGSRMPITSQLGQAVRDMLDQARRGIFREPEMKVVRPILELQERWSAIPASDELLIESVHSREGRHVFLYPFEGHFVHEGLGSLVAWRIARLFPRTIGVTMNDFGFELLSGEPIDLACDEEAWRTILSEENVLEDLLESLNSTELARRKFREVAQVAGLIFSGYPGAEKRARQIQSSSSLLYDVFHRFDPENLLLDQARREVLDRQLEVQRLRSALSRMSNGKIQIVRPTRFTPLAFPLWASRMSSSQAQLSTESMADRVRKMAMRLEYMAGEEESTDDAMASG